LEVSRKHTESSISNATAGLLWARIIGFTVLLGILTLVLHPLGPIYSRLFVGTSRAASFVLKIGSGIILEIAFVVVVWIVVWIEKPRDWKTFLRIGSPDLQGMALFFVLLKVFNGLSKLFLQRCLWNPVQHFLESLGLPSVPMGASMAVPSTHVTPTEAVIILIGLVLVSWGEVPEELFFRGYVQNQLQGRYGKVAAIFLSALVWAAMHLFAPANFAELFCMGACVFGVTFALRQNVTPLAIMHPLSNRAGLMVVYFLEIFGVSVSAKSYWLIEDAALWVLALAVAGAWALLSRNRSLKQSASMP